MSSSSYRLAILFFIGWILLTNCSFSQNLDTNRPAEALAAQTGELALSQEALEASPTSSPEPTRTSTSTPTPTRVPPTPTATNTPTPKWVYNEPGSIEVPILLYHHVYGETSESRYQVSIPDFRAQMAALQDMGYATISMTQFVIALLEGSELPEKPIVITFDDGHQSVYDNALPIMEEFGFTGVFYIVANRIYGSPDFVTIEQLKEMVEAGWEIGSHGYSHADLTVDHSLAAKEIGQSKSDLERVLGTKVRTFAYPFGKIDPFVAQKVNDYGYRAGMGLGTRKIHTGNTLFYLDRIEIYGTYTIENLYGILSGE